MIHARKYALSPLVIRANSDASLIGDSVAGNPETDGSLGLQSNDLVAGQ
jgi:hypothetical protein